MNKRTTLKKIFIASIILILFVPSICSSTTKNVAITQQRFAKNTIERLTNLVYINIKGASVDLAANESLRSLNIMAGTSEVIISVTWAEYSGEAKAELYDPAGNLLATICDPSACYNASRTNSSYTNTTAFSACLTDATGYYVIIYDTYGDGWTGASNITVTSGGATVVNDGGPPSNGNTGVTTETISFDVSGGGGSCSATNSCFGNADAVITETGIDYNTTNQTAVLDGTDGDYAQLYNDTDVLTLDLTDTINAGENYNIVWRRKSTYTFGPFADLIIEESSDNITYTTNTTSPSTDQQSFTTTTITAGIDTRYIRITLASASNDDVDVDAVYYNGIKCGGTSTGGGIPTGNLTCSAGATEITGIVFEDYNYDGLYDATDYQGVKGMPVTATDSLGNSFSGETSAAGVYTISGLTTGRTYRVEFIFPDSLSWAKPTFYGGDNGTTVQFVESGNCATLGVASPIDYCGTNQQVITSCYISGNQTSPTDALIALNYNTSGTVQHIATAPQIGATWGLAFDASSQVIYAAATLKRHIGFGPNGIDAIYIMTYDPATGGAGILGNTIDLASFGINVGTDPRSSNISPLSANPALPSHDENTFGQVGKIGLGDIELSPDGDILYVMNLNNKGQIVKLNVSDLNNVSLIETINIPDPGCSNGDYQGYALKVDKKGEVYVGVTCTGETSGLATDLKAFVYKLNGTTFNQVYSMDLNYPRDCVFGDDANPRTICFDAEWQGWINNFTDANIIIDRYVYYPQPLLSDIEIDVDGSLILGIMDRLGLQTGYENFSTDTNNTTNLYLGQTGGDMLRICYVNGVYILEGDAGCTQNYTGFLHTGTGIQGGEYYDDNIIIVGNYRGHDETQWGAIALLPGSGEVVTTIMDPLEKVNDNDNINAGGFKWFSNQNGNKLRSYELYGPGNTGAFGKAQGLGDIEIVCDPAPIEIGNYVWSDADGDGIQDAGELPLEGIRMELFDAAGNILAFDSTDVNGYYFFSGNGIDDATWQTADDTLTANTNYYIVAGGNGQFASGEMILLGAAYTLTADSLGSSANRYEIDSDGTIAVGVDADFDGEPYVKITTGNIGQVEHTFDFGFRPPCIPTASVFAIQPSCDNGIVQSDGYLQISAFANGDKYNFSIGSSYAEDAGDGSGDTDYANALTIGTLPFQFNTGQSNPTGSQDYTVRVFNGASDCYTDFVVTMNEQSCSTCYALADNGNNPQLYKIDCITGAPTYIGALGISQDVEAIELSPDVVHLYGIASQGGSSNPEFGEIDKSNGAWAPIGEIGTTNGPTVIRPFEMDALTHDEYGTYWTISNEPIESVLLKIDVTTGSLIHDAFGAGIDYMTIQGAGAVNVEDMAYNVITKKFYIVANGSGTADSKLYELDVTNGMTTLVADFIQCNEDIEGLTVTTDGELKGTSGNGSNAGSDAACEDKFYHLSITGTVTEVSDIDPTNTHVDFEAMTCPGAQLVNSCTNPTASVFAIQPSCDNNVAQTDGYLQISEYANGDKVNFSTGSTYSGDTDYANAVVIGALPFQFNTGDFPIPQVRKLIPFGFLMEPVLASPTLR